MAGQADLKKVLTGGSGGGFNYLASGNVLGLTPTSSGNNTATWGTSISVTDVNIDSPTLVTIMDVSVPSGESIILLSGTITALGATSHDLYLELEVDGVTVATATKLASTTSGWIWLGNTDSGTQQGLSNMASYVEVRTNFKLKVRKTGTIGSVVDAFVRYYKVLRS